MKKSLKLENYIFTENGLNSNSKAFFKYKGRLIDMMELILQEGLKKKTKEEIIENTRV